MQSGQTVFTLPYLKSTHSLLKTFPAHVPATSDVSLPDLTNSVYLLLIDKTKRAGTLMIIHA